MKVPQEKPHHQATPTNDLLETESLIQELVKRYPTAGSIQISKNAGIVEVKVDASKPKQYIKISGGLYDLFW